MKFYGKVGFIKEVEKPEGSGIYVPEIIEKEYAGSIEQIVQKWQPAEQVNDNIIFYNKFNLFVDPYTLENLGYMRYIEWQNSKWKISSISVNYPRISVEIGGLYV